MSKIFKQTSISDKDNFSISKRQFYYDNFIYSELKCMQTNLCLHKDIVSVFILIVLFYNQDQIGKCVNIF